MLKATVQKMLLLASVSLVLMQPATAQRTPIKATKAAAATDWRVSPASLETLAQIEELKAKREKEGWTFSVGDNEAMRLPLAQLAKTVVPDDMEQRVKDWAPVSEKLLEIEKQRLAEANKNKKTSTTVVSSVTCATTDPTCSYQSVMKIGRAHV